MSAETVTAEIALPKYSSLNSGYNNSGGDIATPFSLKAVDSSPWRAARSFYR